MSIDQRFNDALNFRDLGGLKSKDGRKVRNGFLFRGAGLAYFNEKELEEFGKLKVKTIMDLRSLSEITTIPDPVIEGASYIQHNGMTVEGSEDIDWSPTGMRKIGGAAEKQLKQIRGYYKTIALNNEAYRIMLKEIEDRHVPIYFHCMTGKDRTGVGAMIILMALGVKEEESSIRFRCPRTKSSCCGKTQSQPHSPPPHANAPAILDALSQGAPH